MEHAKKFALVPHESVSKHIPNEKQLTEFDREMAKILNSKLTEYEKVQKYYELLQKKMKMENSNLPWTEMVKTEENEKVPITSDNTSDYTSDYTSLILKSVPKTLVRNTTNLLSVFKSHPDLIKWNDKGEVTIRNQHMKNSNIIDLLNLISTNKKKSVAAQEEFLKVLEEINIPRNFVKNINLTSQKKKISPVKRLVKKNVPKTPTWAKIK